MTSTRPVCTACGHELPKGCKMTQLDGHWFHPGCLGALRGGASFVRREREPVPENKLIALILLAEIQPNHDTAPQHPEN